MIDYRCTECGNPTARDKLTVKQVNFKEMGRAGRSLRSRTEAWLCPTCVRKDPTYNLAQHDAPGTTRVTARGGS